jgi:hypothetical protein
LSCSKDDITVTAPIANPSQGENFILGGAVMPTFPENRGHVVSLLGGIQKMGKEIETKRDIAFALQEGRHEDLGEYLVDNSIRNGNVMRHSIEIFEEEFGKIREKYTTESGDEMYNLIAHNIALKAVKEAAEKQEKIPIFADILHPTSIENFGHMTVERFAKLPLVDGIIFPIDGHKDDVIPKNLLAAYNALVFAIGAVVNGTKKHSGFPTPIHVTHAIFELRVDHVFVGKGNRSLYEECSESCMENEEIFRKVSCGTDDFEWDFFNLVKNAIGLFFLRKRELDRDELSRDLDLAFPNIELVSESTEVMVENDSFLSNTPFLGRLHFREPLTPKQCNAVIGIMQIISKTVKDEALTIGRQWRNISAKPPLIRLEQYPIGSIS